jgi:hypothetical protein
MRPLGDQFRCECHRHVWPKQLVNVINYVLGVRVLILLSSEWCDGASFSDAYQGTTADFAGYNVVAYFSEFGNICDNAARKWSDVPLIYSSQMSDVWSGGVAFSV